MSYVPDDFKYSLRSTVADSEKGSLRKMVELKARGPWPYNSVDKAGVQTSASGATPVQLGSKAALRLYGNNATGTSLTFTRHGLAGSPSVVVASGALVDLPCVANANEWDVVRTDVSNTQVTLNVFAYNTV